ncbi:hypothetical protein LINGRAHAP2_LOCUS31116 [Linum grandiflorum]
MHKALPSKQNSPNNSNTPMQLKVITVFLQSLVIRIEGWI